MMEIQKIALMRLLAVLNSLEAQYKIVLPDGTAFGELEVLKRKYGKRVRKYPHGERAAYVKTQIAAMKVGEVKTVPAAGYTAAEIGSAVASTAHEMWGNGNYMTKRTKDGVELMRMG